MTSVEVAMREKIFHLDRSARAYAERGIFSMYPPREIVTGRGSLSEIKPPERMQEVLQDWEGVVERIEDDIFVARLRDMTANEVYPGEIAELPVRDVSEDDRELLQVGAVFYMTVGYYVWATGRRERFGRMVFRRLPGWTASALERARERARRITRFLRPEG